MESNYRDGPTGHKNQKQKRLQKAKCVGNICFDRKGLERKAEERKSQDISMLDTDSKINDTHKTTPDDDDIDPTAILSLSDVLGFVTVLNVIVTLLRLFICVSV